MLQYLLTKTQEIKRNSALYDIQCNKNIEKERLDKVRLENNEINSFINKEDNVSASGIGEKRKVNNNDIDTRSVINSEKISKNMNSNNTTNNNNNIVLSDSLIKKQKVMDDRDKNEKIQGLLSVCPWIPQFTPDAIDTPLKKITIKQRPNSPYTGQPLRTKDLIPINLESESESKAKAKTNSVTTSSSNSNTANTNNTNGTTRFICPVSKNVITSQQIILIKTTGVIMPIDVAKTLAYPTMTCPITSKPFKEQDILQLNKSISSYSSSGIVEATHYKPAMT